MATHRWPSDPCALAGIAVLLSLGGWHLSAQPAVQAHADPSRLLQRTALRRAALASAGTPAVRDLFKQHCMKCHGADGTGSAARKPLPEIPNFTEKAWQAKRKDGQLLTSILDGKGKEMPSFRGKIKEDQAHSLVAHVRAFAPTTKKPEQKERHKSSSGSSEERLRQLQEELDRLRKEYDALSKKSSTRAPPKPSPSPKQDVSGQPVPPAATSPAIRTLFQQHCVKCHGKDGKGSAARDRLSEIPDFTERAWQAKRKDGQLLTSILNGKGEEMPSWREKLSEAQGRGLVAHVRAFAPAAPSSGQEEQEEPVPAEPAVAQPPDGFVEQLLRWLGKFHPAAVHFPIALLTAAAAAELFGVTTGKPTWESVARYCVWFGALTAVVAGLLGWFRGGLRLTDPSWILMTHRWLGTCTVVCAALVLLLSEVSRRPERRRARMAFRVTLLVVALLSLATGFFGGAVVFGLDHYTWPS
jgi:mono/diheme cytochrome c family protein/uncharacterized membrane protein